MKDGETKTFSELHMDNSGSWGAVDDSVYFVNFKQSETSYDITVDGKILEIPEDITPYESAKLTQFLFVSNYCMTQDVWSIVKEMGIERLFK